MSLTKIEQDILTFLERQGGKFIKAKEIAHEFNMRGSKTFKRVIKALNFLEQRGDIQVNQRGEYARQVKFKRVVGTYRANAKGYGFIAYAEGQPDLFVPQGESKDAMNGDEVEVEIIKQVDPATGKGSLARVVDIKQRASQQLVGEFIAFNQEERDETGYLGYIHPQGDYSDAMKIYILEDGIYPAHSSICIVQIKTYPSPEKPNHLEGIVSKEIGHKDEPGVDILAILFQFDIPSDFSDEVKKEADAIPQEIDPEEIKGRLDLRDDLTITIDSITAKDLDDAISLTKKADGNFHLGVHIADVAYYVQEGTAIDKEAQSRGTSVYLTDRVVPMLPQRLSNGICSLLPEEDRLTLSCIMDINDQGKVLKYQILPTVIHSDYRMTYTDVNAIIDGDERKRQEFVEIVEMIDQMTELHHILEQMRHARGALNFDAKEAEIKVDAQGHPTDIVLRERYTAERLIESFMLVANETVAAHYEQMQVPFIYRIHEQPDPDRMDRFAAFITSFGMVLRGNTETIKPKQLQETLEIIQGQPYEPVVSMMMLRSMQQACYSEEPMGHYGLATEDYTHFTSPIRRYPDLLGHRLIHAYRKDTGEKALAKWAQKIPSIAEHASKMERRAVDAERETDALKKCEYMADKVGQQFEGMISSVTNFGLFVALPNTIEGLIAIDTLGNDYFYFNQEHLMLIGERTGKIFRIGQKVVVELAGVNVAEKEINFTLIEAEDIKDVTVVGPSKRRKEKKGDKGAGKKGHKTIKKGKNPGRPKGIKGIKKSFKIKKRKK